MPLVEEPKKYPPRTLVLIGIPVFLSAVIISIGSHLGAHYVADLILPGFKNLRLASAAIPDAESVMHPLTALVGLIWTFLLSLGSFAFFLHHPRSLFATSMAFINTALRLPEMVAVFLQFLLYNRTTLVVDESYSLLLLRLNNPAMSILFLCFFSLSMIFLLMTIIHDTKTIPWKWLVAIILFIAVFLIKNWMVGLFGFSTL
jgi:hypothetical protein